MNGRSTVMRTTIQTAAVVATTFMSMMTPAHAETVSAQKIAENARLTPLKKITVGPDDQYAAAVDPSRGLLVYVHKADLVAHLVAHDLKSGDEVNLLPLTADSQEPVFSPSGRLVFTYFKHEARGDICFFKPATPTRLQTDEDITCLPRAADRKGTQRSNPFWMNEDEIGYLERDVIKGESQIVATALANGSTRTLVKGSVWSPSMRSGGHLLVYNELLGANETRGWKTVLRDLGSGKSASVHLAMPGLSGFPVLSEDERYLYFSHFMNDSNDDQMIDGSDNAVVFRLPVADVFGAKVADTIMPEQLTSSDSSCSFPRPIGDQVYTTCAFEGSLDIYSMPLSGTVPTAWSLTTLQNALQTSRSYADRILLLNTTKTRAGKNIDLDQSLFFNHLMEDDTVAARFYLSRITGSEGASFNSLVRFWLQARELQKAQPVDGEVSRDFRRSMMEIDQKAAVIKGEEGFSQIVRGSIRADLLEWSEAQGYLTRARTTSAKHPIERYFRFELARRLGERALPKSLPALTEAYRTIMTAPELSEESQIYYAFNWLKTLAENQKDVPSRIAMIAKINHEMKGPVATLLNSEMATLGLLAIKSDVDQDKAFRDVNKFMNESRTDYYLRKAIYVRAILTLTAAANFKYLSIVASNWLRDTSKADTEFSYAREVYADASLDQAYAYLGRGDLPMADGFFYGAAQATDDLESHFGYITTLVRENNRAGLDKKYKYLSEQHFVEDNMKYVRALLKLIDAAPADQKNPRQVESLNSAIAELESMNEDRDSATRHLLLGYGYMEKLLRTAEGAEFDSPTFEAAHRHLMLAYDLGRDNVRIRISALMDLGLLHERVLNHALAARYFALRLKLPFEDAADKTRFNYLYARALDRARQPEAAMKVLADVAVDDAVPAMIERQGYEAALAGRFQTASEYYEKLLIHPENIVGDENRAKVHLMYGYTLLRSNRKASAILNLKTAITDLKKIKSIPRDQDHMVELDPNRLLMIADGFLAQAALDPKDEIAALEERSRILSDNLKVIDSASESLIQTHLQLAEAWQQVNLAKMKSELDIAMSRSIAAGDGSMYLSRAVFRTLVSYLSVASLHPELFTPADGLQTQKVYQGVQKAYAEQLAKVPQDQLTYQGAKLDLLWGSFTKKVMHASSGMESGAVLQKETVAQLKSRSPELWSELDALSKAL